MPLLRKMRNNSRNKKKGKISLGHAKMKLDLRIQENLTVRVDKNKEDPDIKDTGDSHH